MKLKELIKVLDDETYVIVSYSKWTAVSEGYLGELIDTLSGLFGDKTITRMHIDDAVGLYDATLIIDIED